MSTEVLTNLRQLHDAMVTTLRAHYRDLVPTIAAYDPFPQLDGPDPQPLITPAILLQLDAIDPGEDDGTDRQPLRLTWVAHCVLSFRTEQVQLELRELAADVLSLVRNQRWGLSGALQVPTALSALPGEFVPGLQGSDSWQVRWEQQTYIGPSVWASRGVLPLTVWLGQAPEIGVEHVDDYDLVAHG